ncbi:MAG: hypothetical protein JF887_06530 [Candidatus Dormibacteraeota bacterium]|uniref:Glycosyltransferase RgtA/B/C/D-like domain-containing protein n=1 Tax=Candidatus Amunia macphersoniae TaxID=3127014 RepID=A0A934KJU7_9BACT|nr:hypothetical protein [Candidatus Dormibacteraeota bacterium]
MASSVSVTAFGRHVLRVRAVMAASPALRAALTPFLAAKIVALLVPVLVVWSTSDTAGHPAYHEFVRAFAFWDGATYIDIAEHGYPAGPLDLTPGHPGHVWGFFPGLPLLLSAGTLVFRDVTSTGILINAGGELVALFFLARLVLLERDGDTGSARFACWLLAFFPDAVFLSVVYTDSVFMAAAIASLYYMRRGDNGRACLAAGLGVAMRVTGLVLVPVLLVEYLWRRRGRPGFGLGDIALTVTPVIAFCWFALLQTGDFLAYKTVQQSVSYGARVFAFPWEGLQRTWESAQGGGPSSFNFLFLSDVVWGLAGLVALCYFALNWRRFPPSLTLFSAGVWLLATSLSYWQGLMRYEIAFIPVYLAAADLRRRRPQAATLLLAASAGWMVFQTYTFATGRFIV